MSVFLAFFTVLEIKLGALTKNGACSEHP